MKKIISILILLPLSIGLISCTSPKQLKKTIEENPDILFNAIEKHPDEFLKVLKKAARAAESVEKKNAAKKEEQDFENEFKNPKKPLIAENRIFFSGNSSSPVTIVEYSDFLCYYCSKAQTTVKKIKSKYGDKVRILYKHLPFKPGARLAAQYFEAVGEQSAKKAEKFHDILFENQKALQTGGEKFLKSSAKKVGANLSKIAKAIKSDALNANIASDEAEATKFAFRGTPGFLVNGVSVRGAYPYEHFEKVIERHLKK